jgi:hypothetical protein
LANLPDAEFDALLAVFDGLSLSTPRRELVRAIRAAAPEALSNSARTVLDVFLGIHGMGTWSGFPPRSIGRLIAETPDLQLSDDVPSRFVGRVERILDVRLLAATAKAIDVATEHERLFHGARIFTDIRSVFLEEPPASPVSAVLSHSLRIDFHSESGNDSLFVALDGSDLRVLRAVIDRAIAKADALQETLTSQEIIRVEDLGQPDDEGTDDDT